MNLMFLSKLKNNNNLKGKRFLISVNVRGSVGPIRFVVNEDEVVVSVIETALKMYAREGRLPVLGFDANCFLLHCPLAGPAALSPWDMIGSNGARNFILCKKPESANMAEAGRTEGSSSISRKGSWKERISKSFNLRISSH